MTRRPEQGFTLIELILALSIVAALLAMSFGGLRLGLSAWRQGEDRAEVHQHARSISQVLAQALAGTHAYLAAGEPGTRPAVVFEGEPTRVGFVTVSPPFPPPLPVAFTAVSFALEAGSRPGLAIRQKVMPNADPFEEGSPLFVDPAVTGAQFRYLHVSGEWAERWEPQPEESLPKAIEVTLTTALGRRQAAAPPLVVSIRAGSP